jgi:hypothetical protein
MTHDRIADDNYATPPLIARWAVVHALELLGAGVPPHDNLLGLEPACGDTAPFGLAMAQRGLRHVRLQDVRDVNPDGIRELWAREHGYADGLPSDRIGVRAGEDYLTTEPASQRFDLVAVNPPYRDAEAFVRRALCASLNPSGVAVFLLRLGFLESRGRVPLFQDRPPAEVQVLTARPSFAHGKTDSTAYGLFFWLGDAADKLRRALGAPTRLGWIDNGVWDLSRGRVRIEKGVEHGTP